MKIRNSWYFGLVFFVAVQVQAQNPVIDAIIKEATQNSKLEVLAHEILDGVGPRLVGSPQMQKAHDLAVTTYQSWGIPARNEKWGEWRGWERGITHMDMVAPWTKSLAGTQLAWSPSSPQGGVKGEVVVLPEFADSLAFQKWLPSVKGKYVMISLPQPTGRPDYNWDEYGTPESIEKMKKDRTALNASWTKRLQATGKNRSQLPLALENAGAAGILTSNWSSAFGANKIFSASTKKVPTVDISLEDYGMLYRLAESGKKPMLHLNAQSKETGMQPTYNTVAEIKGSTKPDEYVMLSAHFDGMAVLALRTTVLEPS